MTQKWHFFDAATGLFAGRTFSGEEAHLACNTPAGVIAVPDVTDPESQRVDIASGQLVDYQPPQPSSDHEWNTTTRRWRLTATAQAKLKKRQTALAAIGGLEEARQPRAVRDALLGRGTEALQKLDGEIAALRQDLA
jgi:hypothetical protein